MPEVIRADLEGVRGAVNEGSLGFCRLGTARRRSHLALKTMCRVLEFGQRHNAGIQDEKINRRLGLQRYVALDDVRDNRPPNTSQAGLPQMRG